MRILQFYVEKREQVETEMTTLLHYDITTTPFPLQASPASGNLYVAQLTIVGSNPTPSTPITLQGLIITLPVGTDGSDLTPDPTGIGPIPPTGWTLHSTETSPGSVKFIFYPAQGQGVVTDAGLSFILNNLEINQQPGTAEIEVMEGSNDCQPPNCPTQDLMVTKFPNGWGQVFYWTSPDPPIVPYDTGVTLNWSGPAGATYTIEYYTPQTGVVNVPAAEQPALANVGQYPATSDPPLQLTEDTTFYLSVVETINQQTYNAQQYVPVTIEVPKPTIKLFKGELQWANDSLALFLQWDTENATNCTITDDPHPVNNSSTNNSYQINPTVEKPLRSSYTLTAENAAGSTTSEVTIEWGTSPAYVYSGGGSRGVAVSPDNARLFVANDNDRTVSVLDAITLKAITSPINIGRNYASYVAVTPDNTRVYVTNWFQSTVVALDASTLQPIGGPITVGGAPLGIAVAPDSSHAFVVDDGGTLMVLQVSTLQPTGLNIGIPEQCQGVAVSPDSARVFIACPGDNTLRVFDAKTRQPIGGPISVGNGPCDVAVSADNAYVFVPNVMDNTITVLDAKTLKPVGPNISASVPTGVVVSPDNVRLYVTNCNDGTVSIIIPSGVTGGTSG